MTKNKHTASSFPSIEDCHIGFNITHKRACLQYIASSYTSLRFYHRFFVNTPINRACLQYIVSPAKALRCTCIELFILTQPDIRGLLSFLQQLNFIYK